MKKILITLSEKWADYLLEILVITIGILGAFALNSWNEERLEQREEREILRGVRSDLQNTISEFEFLNEVRGYVLAGTEGIIALSKEETLNRNAFDSLLGLTFFRPTFNNKLGAINLLFSSGKINLISNDSIRLKLIALPGTIEDVIEEEIYASNLFQNLYYPKLAEYIHIQSVDRFATAVSFFGAKHNIQVFDTPAIPADYEGLISDREFFNHLRMRASHMMVTSSEAIELIEQLKKLNESITRELNP